MNAIPMTRISMLASLRLVIVLASLLGLFYPFVVTTLSGTFFPHQATGSMLYGPQGKVVGSTLVGQSFRGAEYFHGRPSAAENAPNEVSGSNLAPSNPALRARALEEVHQLHLRDGLKPGEIPIDLLAASGSGIDPHISPAAAMAQVPRISRERGLQASSIKQAIQAATQYEGFLGRPSVNVLTLNLALDTGALEGTSDELQEYDE
ncbi:potassium-transporting ATPase subunit KdpC [Cobetia sp. Ld8]|uniref:potassium-transporting ATPase subunit KdpC n=1 Tax=Cobetia sp. Ld8 TaxID=649154 RepID=UPI00386A6FC8